MTVDEEALRKRLREAINRSLTGAGSAGVTDTLRDMSWLADMIDASLPKPGPRGPYRKKDNSN